MRTKHSLQWHSAIQIVGVDEWLINSIWRVRSMLTKAPHGQWYRNFVGHYQNARGIYIEIIYSANGHLDARS